MLGEHVLLGVVRSKLVFQGLLHVFLLVLKVENAPVASCVDHFSLDRVDLLAEEGDPFAFVSDLVFVLGPLSVLHLDDLGLVLAHLFQFNLGLYDLSLQLGQQILPRWA